MMKVPHLNHDKIKIDIDIGGHVEFDIAYSRGVRPPPSASYTASDVERLPTVVFLPFWGGSAETFATLQNSIMDGYPEISTVAVSYPGTGRSRHTPAITTSEGHNWTPAVENLATAIELLLRQLELWGPRVDHNAGFVLAGHSMGGKIALALLAQVPNLLVKGILLLAPAPPGPMGLTPEERSARASAYDTKETAAAAIQGILTHMTVSQSLLEDLAHDAASMNNEMKSTWMAKGVDEDLRPKLAQLSNAAKATKIRVLVNKHDLVETVDRVRTETVEVLQHMDFNDVTMRVIERGGHLMPIEVGRELGPEIRDFVRGV